MNILLFSLGGSELYGINVYKIREVCPLPRITALPGAAAWSDGLISLRGALIPVASMHRLLGAQGEMELAQRLIIAEFGRQAIGLRVHAVDHIVSIDTASTQRPSHLPAAIAGVLQLADGRLVSLIDTEEVFDQCFGAGDEDESVEPVPGGQAHHVVFVDDSRLARTRLAQLFDRLQVRHSAASDGAEGWSLLDRLAKQAARRGVRTADEVSLVVLDAEMPDVDGLTLARRIRADARFDGVGLLMHSALSCATNRAQALSAGVDGYVGKFDRHQLAGAVRSHVEIAGRGAREGPPLLA